MQSNQLLVQSGLLLEQLSYVNPKYWCSDAQTSFHLTKLSVSVNKNEREILHLKKKKRKTQETFKGELSTCQTINRIIIVVIIYMFSDDLISVMVCHVIVLFFRVENKNMVTTQHY
ncbi:GQ67_00899T0 [Komagataella phaffii]|nr:GQ67_00899T0 [Komagataella phaffii]AOA67970.1 GQ68_00490T0 [Komagataella phaffii GS115]